MFTRSQDSPATEFSNALVPGKKASKAGRSDCWFDFFLYGNSGDSKAIPIKCFVSHRPPSREGGSVGRAKKKKGTIT